MPGVAKDYRLIAPDMRGFGDTEQKPIDATRGLRDWSDDSHSLLKALGIGRAPHVVGWSTGGAAIGNYAIDHGTVASMTLVDPVSPHGFGGVKRDGTPCFPDHAGSGGGTGSPDFTQGLASGDRGTASPFSPRNVINPSYWRPDHRQPPESEEMMLDEVLKSVTGELSEITMSAVPCVQRIGGRADGRQSSRVFEALFTAPLLRCGLRFVRLRPVRAALVAFAAILGPGLGLGLGACDSTPPPVAAVASAPRLAASDAPAVATPALPPAAPPPVPPVAGVLPDSSLTPGEVFADSTAAQVCVSGYARRVRNVLPEQYLQVYAGYGLTYPQPPGSHELDHLVPLELGGDNSNRNLWPEPALPVPGFHQKDDLENFLHDEVCAGRLALTEAQRGIASDWVALFQRFLGGGQAG